MKFEDRYNRGCDRKDCYGYDKKNNRLICGECVTHNDVYNPCDLCHVKGTKKRGGECVDEWEDGGRKKKSK